LKSEEAALRQEQRSRGELVVAQEEIQLLQPANVPEWDLEHFAAQGMQEVFFPAVEVAVGLERGAAL
jgi:hypothetical protein